MSRELKFRAWESKEKRWAAHQIMPVLKGIIERLTLKDCLPISGRLIIEQYTGLKDRQGTDIYEGDIVEIAKYGEYQVIWNEWACKFDFDKIGKREREEPLLSQDWEKEAKVIGNIHENPELLEN